MSIPTTDPKRADADAPSLFGSNIGKFVWNEEAVERLTALWADGHSASEIANIFGGITRNAVIGKVHRLGLSGDHRIMDERSMAEAMRRVIRARQYLKEQRARRPKAPPKSNGKPASVQKLHAKAKKRLWADEPKGGVSIFDLRPNQCRWPLDERDDITWKFCGEKVEREGARYCAHHACRVYRCEIVEKEAA